MAPTNQNRLALALSGLALAVAVAGAGGPVVAAAFDARNADKVDGKHAVGAKAGVEQRKGKLVATSPTTGRLPNNVIAKAPDAARLGGEDPSVYLDRYTRAEVDTMPSRRVLGFGNVNGDGSLRQGSYFPAGTVQKAGGTGHYFVRVPGYGPGCARPFPVVVAAPQFATGQVNGGYGSMSCGSGDVSMQVDVTNSAGTPVDSNFAFVIYDGGTPAAPAGRGAPSDARTCELLESGVRCR
jgi:hypothetical protein